MQAFSRLLDQFKGVPVRGYPLYLLTNLTFQTPSLSNDQHMEVLFQLLGHRKGKREKLLSLNAAFEKVEFLEPVGIECE